MPSYIELLDSEKKYCEMFFKKKSLAHIFDDREYEFISEMFSCNFDICCRVWDVIEKISSGHAFNKYIILSDFFFSICTFKINNDKLLIFKVSRDEYINDIVRRAFIYHTDFGYEYYSYIELHKKLLIGLQLNGVLNKIEVRTMNNNMWKTVIYFQLRLTNVKMDCLNFVGHSQRPFYQIKYGSTYLASSFRNIVKIKRKNHYMENFNVDYTSTIKSSNTALELSKKIYSISEHIITENTDSILKKVNCKNIEEYFLKIFMLSTDIQEISNLLKNENSSDVIEYKNFSKELKSEYTDRIKDFQKVVGAYILKKIPFDKKMYIPCFVDNRGRQYYGSLVSPTFYKNFRYLYEFSEKKFFYKLETSIFYNKIIKYKNLINEFNCTENLHSYILIILFIEVGKLFVKKGFSIITTEEIIVCGKKHYAKMDLNVSQEDKIYLNKIYFNINNLIKNKEIDENTIIFKDATASGLQNQGIIYGYRKDKLRFLNMDGDDYCDTYAHILELYLKTDKNELLDRRFWKPTIMTIPYNSVWYSCFITLVDNLRKQGIEYNKMSELEKHELQELHKTFYESVKKNLRKDFFENENGELKKFNYHKWIVVEQSEYKINYMNKREKYVNTVKMAVTDEKKSLSASEANNMHYLDSLLVQEISKKMDVICIHDCFGVRMCELHSLIDKINKYYNDKTNTNTYGLHILF